MPQWQVLVLMVAVTAMVSLIEWWGLAALHKRRLSLLRRRHRAEQQLAGHLLAQCRQQLAQLRLEFSRQELLAHMAARPGPQLEADDSKAQDEVVVGIITDGFAQTQVDELPPSSASPWAATRPFVEEPVRREPNPLCWR